MTQDVLVLDDNDFFCPCETGLVCSDRWAYRRKQL